MATVRPGPISRTPPLPEVLAPPPPAGMCGSRPRRLTSTSASRRRANGRAAVGSPRCLLLGPRDTEAGPPPAARMPVCETAGLACGGFAGFRPGGSLGGSARPAVSPQPAGQGLAAPRRSPPSGSPRSLLPGKAEQPPNKGTECLLPGSPVCLFLRVFAALLPSVFLLRGGLGPGLLLLVEKRGQASLSSRPSDPVGHVPTKAWEWPPG
ncbi:formin-like protein 5 [Camelus ferus]|uniref:Formin-like protein 5 n=1 Tax=Camelus ferus TaxID=419612 RepID=A0A8B8SIC9_CAMFR|nr:formin-like protein 5 [Camelus ferus]